VALALGFLFILSLTLGLLLHRQLRLTKRAREDVDAWKQLYEQVRRDRATLLKTLRGLEGTKAAVTVGTEARWKNLDPYRPEQTKNRTQAVAIGRGRKVLTATEPLTLVLPIQLLSKNTRDKLHYQARGKLRKDYQEIIELKYPRREPAPEVRQRATVTRVKGPRERDFDEQNIGAGSAIELVDALTAAGYWIDDSPKWLETMFVQSSSEKVKGPAVLVEIKTVS
jgi:hypothetical protein